MRVFDPGSSFGADVAAHYDDHLRGDEETAATFLAKDCKGGHALEFAIGTGRIALPLHGKGVKAKGIDLSEDMVQRLRAKPGGRDLNVIIGDMSVVTTNRNIRWCTLSLIQSSIS